MSATPPPSQVLAALLSNLELAIRGKREALEFLLCCVAAGGHALLEDVPGTGKTTLAKALALSVGGAFKRVQFTPDLLPTDIVGSSIWLPQEGTFRFKPGPIFANVVIADEINRASPRTQSALLEALSEGQVTVEGETRPLPPPFVCVATQNPIEFHGTYPLPEAQLDRFAVQLSLGYPAPEEELRVLADHAGRGPLADLKQVATLAELLSVQEACGRVRLDEALGAWLFEVVRGTRTHPGVRLGASMRGALLWARVARARALLRGRDFVIPEDLKALAGPVLAHRLVLDARARGAGTDKRQVVADVVAAAPLPR